MDALQPHSCILHPEQNRNRRLCITEAVTAGRFILERKIDAMQGREGEAAPVNRS